MFEGSPIEIGGVAASLALVLSLIAIPFAALGAVWGRPSHLAVARRALYWNVPLVAVSFLVLIGAFVAGDFSVAYVANNSNSLLPLIYRASAAWGAHEGSLLLWLLILACCSAVALRLHRDTHPRSMPWIIVTLAIIQAALAGFILFLSNPFLEIFPTPPDGTDLNPLLQDPGLIFHPPLLYLGYVGFSVPFAFAIAALATGRVGREWVVATRRWTLFSWIALTGGILLGGYWSYHELGWGGYWAWDPVENASLMPWLTATAFLHSAMTQERRECNRTWNLFLILATFALSLSGTFLVRSGILTSVHAFAVDPGRGVFILVFLAFTLIASFGLLAWRADDLGRPAASGMRALSRESAILCNNMIFTVALFTVFFGTMLPLIAEFAFGTHLSVSAPYFNRVMVPMMLAVALLMGIGPAVPWRQCNGGFLRRKFRLPVLAALALPLPAWMSGHWVAATSLAVLAFAATATLLDWRREAVAFAAGGSVLAALPRLLAANRRRYGGLTVHLGVVVIALGLVGSGLFRDELRLLLSEGDRFEIGGYEVLFTDAERLPGPNYLAHRLNFEVTRNGDPVDRISTEKRSYPGDGTTTTEAGIRSTLLEDLYFSFEGTLSDGRMAVRAYRSPLVSWIWGGWILIIVGSGIALSAPRRHLLPAAATPA